MGVVGNRYDGLNGGREPSGIKPGGAAACRETPERLPSAM